MILNISGRTDIVAFYSDWLMNRLKEGYWIKIKEDKCIRVINGAMIQDVKTNK